MSAERGCDGAVLPRAPYPYARATIRCPLPAMVATWPPMHAAAIADVVGGTWRVVACAPGEFNALVRRAERQRRAARDRALRRWINDA